MKTKSIFVLLAGCFLGLCTAMAQAPLASESVHYANEIGDEVIVRNSDDMVLVICSKAVDGSNDHTFMVRSLTTGVTQGFTCNLGTMFSQPSDNYFIKDMRLQQNVLFLRNARTTHSIMPTYTVDRRYHIHDMRISDSICFFCGTQVTRMRFLADSLALHTSGQKKT